jgi:gamma-glutamylcyclotransferase (GGCT)/AIG2-like uncharacterized protein YtfP
MKHILVFGSLRQHSKRGYNFDRFSGQKFIRNIELDGFEMYDLGSFPAICRGQGKIKAELHSVEDVAAERIERMEIGAGYKSIPIDIDNIKASIYIMDKERLQGYPKVESGDWD